MTDAMDSAPFFKCNFVIPVDQSSPWFIERVGKGDGVCFGVTWLWFRAFLKRTIPLALECFWNELGTSVTTLQQVQNQSKILSEIAKHNATIAKRLNTQFIIELKRSEQMTGQRQNAFNEKIDIFEKRSTDALASRMTMIYGLTHSSISNTYKTQNVKANLSTKLTSYGHYTIKFFGGGGHIVAILKFPNDEFLFMDPNTGVWHCTSNKSLDSLIESQIDGLYSAYVTVEIDFIKSYSEPVIAV
ncbi:MAG: hypothetical protein LUC93_11375 [Planctomycetaceae bacterium]|nr:hypothetical protein [Planctomycetaceae bacterium]